MYYDRKQKHQIHDRFQDVQRVEFREDVCSFWAPCFSNSITVLLRK